MIFFFRYHCVLRFCPSPCNTDWLDPEKLKKENLQENMKSNLNFIFGVTYLDGS
jgi:hypothetical protein